MRWLQRFFRDENPVVKLTDGLTEPTAELYRQLLLDSGIPAMVKNMGSLAYLRPPMANTFAIFVRKSDLEHAELVLEQATEE